MTNLLAFMSKLLLVINLPLIIVGTYSVPLMAIVLLIAAPYLAMLMNLAISRTREFDADLEAAKLTGDPIGLAKALQKLNFLNHRGKTWLTPVQKIAIPKVLRTHPTTIERVERLQDLAPRYEPIFQQAERQWVTLYQSPRYIIRA